MGELIKGEWKKLIQWKFFFLLVLLMIVLNGVLLREQQAKDFEETQNTGVGVLRHETPAEEEEISYETFLNHVEEQSDKMQSSAVFNDSSFNRRSLEKTRKVYDRLHGIEPEMDYPMGMLYVTDYHLTDIFLLLAVVALLVKILIQERADGLFLLLKPTKNGRAKLICAKYLIFTIVAFVLTVLFFGTNYFVAVNAELLGDGDAAIQSLDGYMASPFAIQVNTYLMLFLLCKWAAVTAVGSVFFFLCVCCRNQTFAVLCIVICFSVELLLWLTVEDYSVASPARQINLAAVMKVSHYFDNYINFNFFGIPVSVAAAGLITVILAVAAGLFLSIKWFSAENTTVVKSGSLLKSFRKKNFMAGISASLLLGEWRKLFLMQKGLLLLAVLLLIQGLTYGDSHFFSDHEEACYQRYSQMLEGELSEEKSSMLKIQEEQFELLEAELEEKYLSFERGEISAPVLNYYVTKLTPNPAEENGLQRAKKQYQYLEKQVDRNEKVAYLYQTGWEKLLGEKGRKAEIFDFVKLLLILLLALSNLGAVEKSSSMMLLILPSKRGIQSVNRVKSLWSTVFALAGAGITFIWRPLQIASYYTLPGLSYSTKSLNFLPEESLSMPLGVYLGGMYILKVMVAVLAAQFIFFLSRKCQKEVTTLFLGTLLLIVPTIAAWWFFG